MQGGGHTAQELLPPAAGAGPLPATAPATVGTRRRPPGRRWLPPLVAAVVGTVLAATAAYLLLPDGTNNLDELVYLNQAEAIRHGRLTFDADTYDPDFRPYLTGVAGDRVVFKYQPLWPAWLALAEALAGDHRPALAAAGGAAALAFWLLARELSGRHWLGTAAAVAVTVSPVFLAHSGTALAYLPASALAAFALAALLRSDRLASTRWAAAAGVGFGVLFFHRPFDAAVVGLPAAAWHLAVARRRPRGWRPVAAVALAGVPFVVAWGAYNDLATGSPLTPAFAVGAPDDRFGFGRRASWQAVGPTPEDERYDYSAGEAALTAGRFAAVTPLWVAGGCVSLVLAGLAVARGRNDPRRRLLAGVVLATVVGHFFWWGTGNFATFGLHRTLGPAYWLVGLGPLAALAVQGAHEALVAPRGMLPRRGTVVAGLAVATAANWAFAGVSLADARDARAEQLGRLTVGAADVPASSVVLRPNAAGDPFLRVLVPADLDAAPRLRAVDAATPAQRFALRDRFPDRSLWAWIGERRPDSGLRPATTQALHRLTFLRTDRAAVVLRVVPRDTEVTAARLRLLTDDGTELAHTDLPPTRKPEVGDRRVVATGDVVAEAGRLRLVGGDGGVEGRGGDAGVGVSVGSGWLAAGVAVRGGDGRVVEYEVRWAVRAVGDDVELVGPGIDHRLYPFGDGHWLREDVSHVLAAQVEGLPQQQPLRRVALDTPEDPDADPEE